MAWVTMEHPTLPGQTARVSADAFDKVWKPKGWRLVEYDVPQPEPDPEPEPETADTEDEG